MEIFEEGVIFEIANFVSHFLALRHLHILTKSLASGHI